MLRPFLSAGLLIGLSLTCGSAYAQVRVQDNVAIGIASDTKSMTEQIRRDTAEILVNTSKTLAAITGDRSAESGQFASAALGGGYSMAEAPDLATLANAGSGLLSGLSDEQQSKIGALINGLNLVASLVDLASGAKNPAVNRQYQTSLSSVTALSGVVEGMSQAANDRTQRLDGLKDKIGSAKDLKGALDQNTQWMTQNALVLNEGVGLSNLMVHQLNEQDKANLLLMSQLARGLKTPKAAGGADKTGSIADQLKALQAAARGH